MGDFTLFDDKEKQYPSNQEITQQISPTTHECFEVLNVKTPLKVSSANIRVVVEYKVIVICLLV